MAGRTKRTTTRTSKKPKAKPKPPSRLKWDEKRTRAFIEAVVEFEGNVSRALLKVGMGRTSFYERCNESLKFKTAVTEARDRGVDVGEDKMRDRAYRGVSRYELFQGRVVYLRNSRGGLIGEDGKRLKRGQPAVPVMRTEYSDAIAVRIMEAYRQRYRTRRTEVTGAGGQPLNSEVRVITTLPDNGRVPMGAGSAKPKRRNPKK